jgi:endonuclease G
VAALLGLAGAGLHACQTRVFDDRGSSSGTDARRGKDRDRAAPSSSAEGGRGGRDASGKGAVVPARTKRSGSNSVHLAMGVPEDNNPADDHLMVKPQYALSYNKELNVANWVSWQLDASWFGDAPRFKGKFMEDPDLPDGFYRVRHEDYVNSGYDRGHMVRSEERTRSPEDNKTTFFLTNILPQYHELNAGPWLRLEEHCQDLATKQKKQLFVMAGGLPPRGKRFETIGKGVYAPDTFFKIVVVLEPRQDAGDVSASTEVIAVLMPNDKSIMNDGWEKYRTSIDEIEKKTGYDFLPAVSEDVQQVIEARR